MNNESADIIRILISAFDHLLPLERREASKGPVALIPNHLRDEIDELNSWVYDTINNGVYKVGFASSQADYDKHITKLFLSLDRLEEHLTELGHHPYLFGAVITEADVRLYTTLIRFDVAYYTLFKCNIKMIRLDYPRLHAWLRRLYWDEGPETAGGVFKKSTQFEEVSQCSPMHRRLKLMTADKARLRISHSWQWRCACWANTSYHAFVSHKRACSLRPRHYAL